MVKNQTEFTLPIECEDGYVFPYVLSQERLLGLIDQLFETIQDVKNADLLSTLIDSSVDEDDLLPLVKLLSTALEKCGVEPIPLRDFAKFLQDGGKVETEFPKETVQWLQRIRIDIANGEIPVIENLKPKDDPIKNLPIEKRFDFHPGQVFFDDMDLELPEGRCVEIFEMLVKAWGRCVKFQTLDTGSGEHEASQQLRDNIRTIRKKINDYPFQIKSIKSNGYKIQTRQEINSI